MKSQILEKYIKENYNHLHTFVEIGVYEWGYCRLQREIKDGKFCVLVEPLKRCYDDIFRNIGHLSNTIIYNVAIGDYNGETIILDEGASAAVIDLVDKAPFAQNKYYGPGTFRAIKEEEKQPVNIVTFDKIEKNLNIDVLYLDCESSEWFVIKNMKSRPTAISVETHYGNYKNPYIEEIHDWMKINNYILVDRTDADEIYLKKIEFES